MLEVPYWEAAENYLGAAPIRPGRHRYRHKLSGFNKRSAPVYLTGSVDL